MAKGAIVRPSYNDRVVIKRDRNGWEVTINDPELRQQNADRGEDDDWVDPEVEFNFQTTEQVIAFLTSALDKALPEDTFASTFDQLAKKANEA